MIRFGPLRGLALLSLLLMLTACLKPVEPTSSGEGAAPGAEGSEGSSASESPASSSSEGASSQDPSGTAPSLAVAPDGRVQQTDAMGNPLFDAEGNPVWAPTQEELAVQLFDEALLLRRGVAGGPPNLISAASKFQEALELDPDLHEARYNLGLTWFEMHFFDDAVATLTQVLKERPDMVEAQLVLGMTHERRGDLGRADLAYARGLRKGKDHPGLLNGQARVLLKRGRLEQAEAAAKAILKIDSNSIDAFNTLGLTYRAMGELERARFAFMKAGTLPGGDKSAAVTSNLGLVEFRMGKEFEARLAFEQARKLDPGEPGAMVNLAHLMLVNLDFEGARSLLSEAARMMPGNIPVKLNLAVALRGTGDTERAQQLYQEIVDDPDTEYRDEALLNLGILQGDFLKDFDSAIQSYEEYIALRESAGEPVEEGAPVFKYLKEVRKKKRRRDRKRQRESESRSSGEEAE
ncbi:MAG: tetratricopeptide repeat protein [Myxococcota bacterium]|nr:tetratricopeptide repeat protein [Myxococcota bacterium]